MLDECSLALVLRLPEEKQYSEVPERALCLRDKGFSIKEKAILQKVLYTKRHDVDEKVLLEKKSGSDKKNVVELRGGFLLGDMPDKEGRKAKLVKIASKANHNQQNVVEILSNLLKTCFYFNVTDAAHIAYILATITDESGFGTAMEEKNTPQLKAGWYEPVFDFKNLLITPDKKRNALFYAFEMGIKIMDEGVTLYDTVSCNVAEEKEHGVLKKSYVAFCPKGRKFLGELDQKTETDLKDIEKQTDKPEEILANLFKLLQALFDCIFAKINDEKLRKHRQELKEKKNLFSIMKSLYFFKKTLVANKYPDLLLLTPAKITKLDEELETEDLAKLDANKVRYYEVHIQLIMFGWLLLRIWKSHDLGNNQVGDGEKYKGRGFVQLTGRDRYQAFFQLFAKPNSRYLAVFKKLGGQYSGENLDFRKYPERVIDQNIGLPIVVGGMAEGKFTNPKFQLSSYGSGESFDFLEARKIINAGDTVLNATKYADSAKKYFQALAT